MKVLEIKNLVKIARDEKAGTPKTKKAYDYALDYLSLLPNNLEVNPRLTVNNAVNIGDIGEILGKYLSDNKKKRVYKRSIQGENDLDTYHKSEWKTFTVANRPANGLQGKRRGFTALTPKGIAWIPYSVLKNYITLTERIKLSVVYQMIEENDLHLEPLF